MPDGEFGAMGAAKFGLGFLGGMKEAKEASRERQRRDRDFGLKEQESELRRKTIELQNRRLEMQMQPEAQPPQEGMFSLTELDPEGSKWGNIPESVRQSQRTLKDWKGLGVDVFAPQDVAAQLVPGEEAAAPPVTKEDLSPGELKVDQDYANEYNEWVSKGGFADAQKSIDQLEGAIQELKTDKSLTGPARGVVPDVMRAFTNPKALQVKAAIEEVVQRNLRLVLGAQFTEKEGIRLIERAYDERLSEEENIKRVERLIGQIKSAADAKSSAAEYWQQEGTLKGWKGKTRGGSPVSGDDGDDTDIGAMTKEEMEAELSGY